MVLSNLIIRGLVQDTSSKQHTVIANTCRFYPLNALDGAVVNVTASVASRFLINDCEYTNDYPDGSQIPFSFYGTDTTIEFTNCDIQNPQDCNTIYVGGSGTLQRVQNCYIENTGSGVPTSSALIAIGSTTAKTHSMGLNIFSFSNAGTHTNPAILFTSVGTATLLSNFFSIKGNTGDIIKYSGSAPTLIVDNNSANPLYGSTIQSGTIVVASKPVGQTFINTVSGTAGRITASTTSGATTVDLATSGVSAGVKAYPSSLTVDTYGRITSITAGSAPVASVSGTAPIVSSGGTTPAISLSASGVVANTYGYPSSLTVDTYGRITSATAGTNPSGTYLPLAGGTMTGSIDFASTYNASNVNALTATTVLGANFVQAGTAGYLGFKASGGAGVQTYSLVYEDATGPSSLGMKRCKLNTSNAVVAGSTGFLYDQFYNQTVAVPFSTSGASFIAPIGTSITNSLTKIITQSIQPNGTAWNFLTARQWGILGNFTLITASAKPMRFTMTYQLNGGTERTLASTYIQNNAYMTVPVNNISFGTAEPTLSANDLLTINIYAQTIVSLDTTTIATAVPFISAIVSPMNYNS